MKKFIDVTDDMHLKQLRAFAKLYFSDEFKTGESMKFHLVQDGEFVCYVGQQQGAQKENDGHVKTYLNYIFMEADYLCAEKPPLVVQAKSESAFETGEVFRPCPNRVDVVMLAGKQKTEDFQMYDTFINFDQQNSGTILKIALAEIAEYYKKDVKCKYNADGDFIPENIRNEYKKQVAKKKKAMQKLNELINQFVITPQDKEKDAELLMKYYKKKAKLKKVQALQKVKKIRRAVESFLMPKR